MNRQKKQLAAAVVLFVLIAAAYLGLSLYNSKHSGQEEAATYTVTNIPEEEIVGLAVVNEQDSFELINENGVWSAAQDKTIKLDQTLVKDMVSRAADIKSTDKIEAVTDVGQYGLDKPRLTITIVTQKETIRLFVGEFNEMISKYYLRVNEENVVYTIDSSEEYTFSRKLDDLKAVEPEGSGTSDAETGDSGEADSEKTEQ